MMSTGSNPHVIHVLGLFKGKLPNCGPSTHLGLVMELMERGSLASLQVNIFLFISSLNKKTKYSFFLFDVNNLFNK